MYRNTFTYDANGNIQIQVRRDSVGGLMDSLSYKYQRKSNGKLVRNRLYNVNDYVTGVPAYLNDITDQGLFDTTNINSNNNYGYDEIGNLVRDNAEQIQNIEWTLNGKIKTITRNIGSSKRNMSFEYDASGNRIAKHVYTSSNNWINSTYYLRDAQGNVMGVYEKTPGLSQGSLSYKLNEAHIYGSSRLGIAHPNLEMIGAVSLAGDTTKYYLGNKTYELSNHLGNVLATISDKKIALDNNNNKIVDGYVADMASSNDYYPFGSPMPGRQFNNGSYRYGFNGKENDNEVKGTGNSLDFGERIYDSRLARFLSLDPLIMKYPMLSPYCFAANSPIRFIDFDGMGPGDRIKKAASFIGTKYSQKEGLNSGKGALGTELRTGTSAKALEYLDCSELVCRVMSADEITKGVKQYGTVDLVRTLGNKEKFEQSNDAPQAGDIFLWRDVVVDKKTGNPILDKDGNKQYHGHTGIVESVDEDGNVHTIEAYGTNDGTKRVDRKLSSLTKHSGWEGFFRPKVETPDGKLDPKPATDADNAPNQKKDVTNTANEGTN